MSSRRFRFFQWNDFHMRNPAVTDRSAGYPGCNEKAIWAAACARGEIDGIEAPDFVASVGDLICGEIADYDDDFSFFDQHLRQAIHVPLLPCLGNHENRQGEGIPAQNVAYDRFFGPGWHNYIYSVGGVSFIVVDTSGAHRMPDEITAARNDFLARAFDHVGDRPVFVLSHVPLIPMRQVDVLTASFGFSSWKIVDERLLKIVEAHAEQVIAVLCGHIHLTGVVERAGIHHIMPSGTAGHPTDFAAFDVFDDRVEMQMIPAPTQLTGDNDRGDIHGARRHGVDYTDADHPNHDSYLRGNAGERQLTITLDAGRRPVADGRARLQVEHETTPGQWVRRERPGPTRVGPRHVEMNRPARSFSRPAVADADYEPEPIQPLPVPDTAADWPPIRQSLLAAWQDVVGRPAFDPDAFVSATTQVAGFEQPHYTARVVKQATTPVNEQTVLVMTPRKPVADPCPGMVVPFYDPDRMIGLDLKTLESLPDNARVIEFGRHLAELGFIVVCPEVYPYNTVPEPQDSSGFGWWQAAADQLRIDHPQWSGVGRLAWDASQALDLLLAQDGIDATRCGIIGHSLGGKIAFYAAALDERFSLCISSDFGIGFSFTNWDDDWYLGNRIHASGFERGHHELLTLMAPRPFFLVGGEADRPASWHYIQEAQRVYALTGDEEVVGFFHHGTGHRPPPEAMRIAYAWLGDRFDIDLDPNHLEL